MTAVGYNQNFDNDFVIMYLPGAWVCFNNLQYLTAPLLSEFAKLMTLVIGALRKEKTSTHFLGEEIPINSKAACIALTSNLLYVNSSNPDSERVFPSVTAQLPDDIVKQFRQCCMLRPDIKLTVETLLLTQGNTNLRFFPNFYFDTISKIHHELM